MKLLKDRRSALIGLVVCILGSVLGFGRGSLASSRSRVEAVFNDGNDTSLGKGLFSMDAYLDNCADYAKVLVREYRLHASGDSEALLRVEELSGVIGTGNDYAARSAAYTEFLAQVEKLYVEYQALGLDAATAREFEAAYTNIMEDQADKIQRDEYHGLAKDFNKTLTSFPASLISKLTGVAAMDPFEGA